VLQKIGGASSTSLQQLSTSPQTQFDLALTLLRHQIQQPAAMTSSRRRDVTGRDDVTESLLLSALGLALPAEAGTETVDRGETTDGLWTPTAIGRLRLA